MLAVEDPLAFFSSKLSNFVSFLDASFGIQAPSLLTYDPAYICFRFSQDEELRNLVRTRSEDQLRDYLARFSPEHQLPASPAPEHLTRLWLYLQFFSEISQKICT
jgi:hypothetical protein